MELTSDVVKSAIATKLHSAFNDIDIYKEKVVEGMTYPSFFINQLLVTPEKMYGNVYMYIFDMAINYIVDTDSTTVYKDLENMGVELLEILDEISIGDIKIKASDGMSTEKTDETQVVFVKYKIQCVKDETNTDEDYMGTLDINIKEVN